jgi:hypothetical protein
MNSRWSYQLSCGHGGTFITGQGKRPWAVDQRLPVHCSKCDSDVTFATAAYEGDQPDDGRLVSIILPLGLDKHTP